MRHMLRPVDDGQTMSTVKAHGNETTPAIRAKSPKPSHDILLVGESDD
jgi:hypothetical protein